MNKETKKERKIIKIKNKIIYNTRKLLVKGEKD